MKKTKKLFWLLALGCLPMAAMAATPSSVPAEVQQARFIKGNVVDENGEPMIGVTIKIVGSTGGTITDLDGNFSLNVPSGRKLQFTYAGYKEQTLSASANMKIKMEPDAVGLDEVVVIGFGTVKKRDVTGAVALFFVFRQLFIFFLTTDIISCE